MDKRKVEVFTDDGWEEIEFENLKVNDIFRMFESDGEPVEGEKGSHIFIAKSNPYLTEEDVWTIKVISDELD